MPNKIYRSQAGWVVEVNGHEAPYFVTENGGAFNVYDVEHGDDDKPIPLLFNAPLREAEAFMDRREKAFAYARMPKEK
jgi:hypothetical protein